MGQRLRERTAGLAHATSNTVRFYVAYAPVLWRRFVELAFENTGLGVPDNEIRLEQAETGAERCWDDDHWKLVLPSLCVATGKPTDAPWQEETLSAPNLQWAFWSPIVGLGIGAVLAVFLWNRWVLPLPWIAGFYVGYWRTSFEPVVVRFRRGGTLPRHQRFPQAWLFGERVSVLVGSRHVRKEFLKSIGVRGYALEEEEPDRVRPGRKVRSAPPADDDRDQPLPMADEAHARVKTPRNRPWGPPRTPSSNC